MLIIARHASSEATENRILCGNGNPPLSRRGLRETSGLSGALGHITIVRIVASDSERAKATAVAVAAPHRCVVCLDGSLRERDYGSYEGLSIDELRAVRKAADHDFLDVTQDWAGVREVESDEAIVARVGPVVNALAEASSTRSTLIVTHAGVIKAFLHHLFGSSNATYSCVHVPPASFFCLGWTQANGLRLLAVSPSLPEPAL